jgi:hypothetical protein
MKKPNMTAASSPAPEGGQFHGHATPQAALDAWEAGSLLLNKPQIEALRAAKKAASGVGEYMFDGEAIYVKLTLAPEVMRSSTGAEYLLKDVGGWDFTHPVHGKLRLAFGNRSAYVMKVTK